jgi:hypothetical protein
VPVVGVVSVVLWAVVPLIAWPMLSRSPRTGIAIEVVIAACLAVLVAAGLGVIETRARIEIALAYSPVAAALMWLGRRIERRGRPAARADRRRAVGRALVAGHVGVVLLCCTPAAVGFGSNPFVPGSSEVLPLPAGLILVSDQELGCGGGVCTRQLTVTGGDGRKGEIVYRRVVDHLHRKHEWRLDAEGSTCRPSGWLLERAELCVEVRLDHQQDVVIQLDGARAPAI